MPPARVAAAMALVLTTASACSALFPVDGLSGSEPDGATAAEAATDSGAIDAAPDSTSRESGGAEASGLDAPAEGADAADVGPPTDATDAPAEAEAASPFCASLSPKPALCEDFDEGAAFNAQFTSTNTAVPANLGADGAFFRSPPDSLFSKVSAGASPNNAYAYMERTFTGAGTRVEYAFDLLVQQTVAGHEAVMAMVVVNEGTATEHDLGFVLGNLKTMEQSFAGADGGLVFVETPLATSPKAGVWSHVDIAVSLAQQTMTVTVDGAAAVNAVSLDPSWPTSGTIAVRLGISFANDTTTAWAARYDDVTANLQ